jgi:sugar transferase EpsL
MIYRRWGKRVLDLGLGVLLLAVSAPLQLVVALVARCAQGSPVLFRQQRAGLHGQPFTLYKFRTMRDGDEPPSQRVTGVGTLLRRSSLDELPQLFNILSGDMSFVGPRPLHLRYLPRYDERQRRRLEARPGLTGLAQVHGRNLVDWPEKLEWDVRYVETLSLGTDVRILFRTAMLVVRGAVSANDSSTTPGREFLGTESLGSPR